MNTHEWFELRVAFENAGEFYSNLIDAHPKNADKLAGMAATFKGLADEIRRRGDLQEFTFDFTKQTHLPIQ